jgi:hypothetical protein
MDGSVLHVYFEVRRYACLVEQFDGTTGSCNPCSIKIAESAWLKTPHIGQGVLAGIEIEHEVRDAVAEPRDLGRWIVWEGLVRELRRKPVFYDSVFFRVERLRSSGILDHRYVRPFVWEKAVDWHYSTSPVQMLRYEAGFQIQRSAVHTLKVVAFQGNANPDSQRPRTISVEYDSSYFASSEECLEVLSDYDTFFLSLFPKFSADHVITRLRLSVPTESNGCVSPAVALPLEICHPRRTLMLALLWIFLGLTVQFFSSKAMTEWIDLQGWLPGWTAELVAIGGSTLTLIFYALAIVVVTRRAPTASIR